MDWNETVKKYSFIKTLELTGREHFEVSEEAVRIYKSQYDVYSDYIFNGYKRHRHQMTSSGAWLSKNTKNSIDIVGDILTSYSAVSFLEDYKRENSDIQKYLSLFKDIYHSIGNCIPVSEGFNIGGRPFKNGGSLDTYERKLKKCKEIFDNREAVKSSNIDTVRDAIESGKSLSRFKIMSAEYWILTDWENKSWEDFVIENYLTDMVDDKNCPIPFVKESKKCGYLLKGESDEKIIDTLKQSIDMIIKRGYRIDNKIKGRFSEDEMKKINIILKNIYESKEIFNIS